MSGRQRRRQSGTGPASPAQEQEAVGEGELARVLAAVEALTSQELLRTRGSDQLQDADSSRIKVYVRKAGHLPDTMVGE